MQALASGVFIEEQVAVLAHHWLLTLRRTVQNFMEVAVPPRTVLHSNDSLLCAELRPNPCGRPAGRPIPHFGLFHHCHAEAVLRQRNRNQRARCATTDDNDVFSGRSVCYAF